MEALALDFSALEGRRSECEEQAPEVRSTKKGVYISLGSPGEFRWRVTTVRFRQFEDIMRDGDDDDHHQFTPRTELE